MTNKHRRPRPKPYPSAAPPAADPQLLKLIARMLHALADQLQRLAGG